MLKIFTKYVSIGIINTIIHWSIFSAISYAGVSQAASNLAAFCVAVTFSFFANARWTFNAKTTKLKYVAFTIFMGFTATSVGWIADRIDMNPIITMVSFSVISLVLGFTYSKYFVFKGAA